MRASARTTRHKSVDAARGGRRRRLRMFVTGVSAVLVLYMLGTLGRAHEKLLWHDEIYTITVARLQTDAVWAALRDGVDLNPPGFYLLTRASHVIFGEGLIGSRMPAVLGVLLAGLCAAVYVRKRHGPFAGIVAMLLLFGSDAYLYAYEARPYGPVLGLGGVALVCWQSATVAHHRPAWLAGLFASLAGAMACHYYAMLPACANCSR
jgi:uncharacterized membrane protein